MLVGHVSREGLNLHWITKDNIEKAIRGEVDIENVGNHS